MSVKRLVKLLGGCGVVLLIITALKDFESNMNLVDWLVSDLAPKLPSYLGDIVVILALGLLLYYAEVFEKALNKI